MIPFRDVSQRRSGAGLFCVPRSSFPVSENEDLRPNTPKTIKHSKIMKGRARHVLSFPCST